MPVLKALSHEVDSAKLPQASIDALLRRGWNHVFGNEIASSLTARTAKFKDDKTTNPDGSDMSDDAISALREELVSAKFKALSEGTIGTHAPRTVIDPLEHEMRKIAAESVRKILAANGMVSPKKDEKVSLNGQEVTLDDLIDRRIAKFGAEIEKEAKAVIRAKSKKVDAAKAASLDDL